MSKQKLEPVPRTGGSYKRNKDGSLKRLDDPQKPDPGSRARRLEAERKAAAEKASANSAGKAGSNKPNKE